MRYVERRDDRARGPRSTTASSAQRATDLHLQIKGEVDADGTIAFEVWLSVLVFNYEIGLYKCNLLDLEKDPCAFDIHKRYLDGQAGLFPQDDPSDPDMVDLCLVVLGTVKIPHTRVTKHIDFQKCFAKFPKTDPPSVSA